MREIVVSNHNLKVLNTAVQRFGDSKGPSLTKAKTPYLSRSRVIRGLQVPPGKRRHDHQREVGSMKIDVPPAEGFHYSMDFWPLGKREQVWHEFDRFNNDDSARLDACCRLCNWFRVLNLRR